MQRNWIGRSEGARVKFRASDRHDRTADAIEVFTTRIDTIYGATFVLLAPEHPLVEQFARESRRIRRRSARRSQRSARRIATARHDRRDREGRLRHRPHARSIRSPASRCRSGSRTSCSASTAPARSWRVPGARRARLRVRAQVRPADPRRRPAATASRSSADDDDRGARRTTARWSNSGEYNGLHAPSGASRG